MSLPQIHLHIAADVTLKDLSDFLNIEFEPYMYHGRDSCFSSRLGWIDIIAFTSSNLGSRDKLVIYLRLLKHNWYEMSHLIIREICYYLYNKVGGNYYCEDAECFPMFAITENGLIIPDCTGESWDNGFRERYESCPFLLSPFESFTFHPLGSFQSKFGYFE